MNIFEKDKLYIANTYGRFPIAIKEGKGSKVVDYDGKEYIDLATGIAVNTFGIADDEWVQAVYAQLTKLQHASNLYFTEPCDNLAEALCRRTGMKKVFFSNSGAEANECAIKAARKYAAEKKGAEYYNIITLRNSFHGRTLTTLAATGQDAFHKDFLPLTEGFLYAEAGNMEDLKKLAAENKVAAVMMEMVQGEGGVVPLDAEYVKDAAAWALENDILLICDEVQTGNGRSGELYAYMHYGIKPDIISTAKGLAGGLPLGATLLGEKLVNTFTPGSHGSTFGGNPVCCAGALNILGRLTDEVLEGVKERSEYISSALSSCPGVENVTGLGLMIGIKTKKPADAVVKTCMENGVLVIKAKDKVRLLPALNIPMDDLKAAVDVLYNSCL